MMKNLMVWFLTMTVMHCSLACGEEITAKVYYPSSPNRKNVAAEPAEKPEIYDFMKPLILHLQKKQPSDFISASDAKDLLEWHLEEIIIVSGGVMTAKFTEGHVYAIGVFVHDSDKKHWELKTGIGGNFKYRFYDELTGEPKPVSEVADNSLERFEELKMKSKAITKDSSEKDVESILGLPQSTGTGAWSFPERKIWHYLNYTDDSLHRSLSVWFDPKLGCSVDQVEFTRAEIEKLPLLVIEGKVMSGVYENPHKQNEEYILNVTFNREGKEFVISLAFKSSDRIKGKPQDGANVRVEYREEKMDFIFLGPRALYLESVTFTGGE